MGWGCQNHFTHGKFDVNKAPPHIPHFQFVCGIRKLKQQIYIYIFSKLGRHRWSKDSVGARILGIAINKSKVKLNTWILDLVYDRDDGNVFGNPTRSAAKVAGEILRNWLKIIMGKRVGIKRWSYYKSWLNWVVCVLFYLVWF